MKAAIRLAVCVVMAGTSMAALADAGAEAIESSDQPAVVSEVKATMNDDGHGSGEPARMATQISDEDATKAALAEYNQNRFLEETWRAGP